MDKYTVTINLDKIEEKEIWINAQGQRCISCSLVNSPRTWDDGSSTWGFISQWWKDDTLPQGQYPNHPILGNVRQLQQAKMNPGNNAGSNEGKTDMPF